MKTKMGEPKTEIKKLVVFIVNILVRVEHPPRDILSLLFLHLEIELLKAFSFEMTSFFDIFQRAYGNRIWTEMPVQGFKNFG